MVENDKVAANYSPFELIGKEVAVTHAEREFIFPIRQYVLEVIPLPKEDDYELVIGMKSRKKNPKHKYSVYKCRYSEVRIVPVDEGEIVNFEDEEVKRLIRILHQI